MTNAQEDSQAGQRGGADTAGAGLEPRLPWEVNRGDPRQPKGTAASSGIDPSVFAEAGKLNILARIGDLRKEMDSLYHDREVLQNRVAELEKTLGEANERLVQAGTVLHAAETARTQWAAEREDLLGQVQKLEDLAKATESEHRVLVSQLEAAHATLVEIRDALSWRHGAGSGQNSRDSR